MLYHKEIKSKVNSFIKMKKKYAVPQGGQINLYWNSLIKFARKEKEKEKEEGKKRKRKEKKRKDLRKRKKERK